MQKERTKTKSKVKKYGKPYPRRKELRRGDLRLIQKVTGYAYITVCQQLDGTRAISPEVEAMANKLADNNKAMVDAIKNINLNK